LRKNARKEIIQYRELNAKTANHCRSNDMTQTTAPNNLMMKYPPPEIKTLDDLVEWCARPKAQLPNHIPWCFKRFAIFSDYIDHDQNFTLLNNSK